MEPDSPGLEPVPVPLQLPPLGAKPMQYICITMTPSWSPLSIPNTDQAAGNNKRKEETIAFPYNGFVSPRPSRVQ